MLKRTLFLKAFSCLFFLVLLIPTTARGAIPAAERNVLITLYNNTGGAGWTDNTNWLGAAGTECTWYGITCDAGENTVTGIDLNTNNLTGTIPPELGSLSNLTYLSLYTNSLTGSIPPELGNLANLTILYLSTNSLSGTIPPELGSLSNLTELIINTNNFTGTIPPELGSLSNLTSLSLPYNSLSGTIPPELGSLSNLTGLFLYYNSLTGSIPPELGNLSSLNSLALRSNNFTGSIPPELGSLSSLIWLFLSENNLTGTIPPELGSLSGLKYLSLHTNNLSGTIPPELGSLPSIETLDLRRNSLTGTIPQELGNLSNIMYLSLDGNVLSGPIPPEVMNMSSLVTCTIDYNMFYSNDSALTTFLDTYCGTWQTTQTVAPDNLAVGTITDTSVDLSWTAISYTAGGGGYEVHYSAVSGGPYAFFGIAGNKTVENTTVSGLLPGTIFYFVVRTKSDSHGFNPNVLYSEYSSEVSATTTGASLLAATDSVAPVDDYLVPFGGINIAGASKTKTVQIEYLGGAGFGFTLDSVSISGTNASEFSVDVGDGSGTTCGPLPVDFSAPVTCTVDITFNPSTAGTKSAFVDFVFSSDSVPTVRVALTGTGLNPSISVSPPSLDLGDVADGTTSAPMAVTVLNNGTSSLSVSSVTLSDTNAGEFAIASGGTCGNAPFYLAALESCTLDITLTPSGTGGKSATLTITSNDPMNPQVTVSLTGSATSPRISVTPGSIDFGGVTEGISSSPQTITITNTGSHVLNVSGMALGGTNAAEFTLDTGDGTAGTCGTTAPSVPVSGSCSVNITFTPGSSGAKTASLDITSDDPVDSTVSVTLTGNGLSSSMNNPPNAPVLVSPEDGATGIAVPVAFIWNTATDPDGDTVTYDLYICKEASFAACTSPENIDPITASAFQKAVTFAGMTFGVGFIGLAFTGGLSRRRRLALMLAFLILFSVGLIYGCSSGGGSNNAAPNYITYEVSGLDSGVTYYWKVVSADGSESTDSEVSSFTTE